MMYRGWTLADWIVNGAMVLAAAVIFHGMWLVTP